MKEDNLRQPVLGKWPSLLTLFILQPLDGLSADPSALPSSSYLPGPLQVSLSAASIALSLLLTRRPSSPLGVPVSSRLASVKTPTVLLVYLSAKALQDQEWLIPTPTQETPLCQM